MMDIGRNAPGNDVRRAPVSAFEAREQERRQKRVERLDRIVEQRIELADRNAYYAQQVHRLVHSLVIPGSRVLEVGCGLGDLLATLELDGSVGIDISPRMIEEAKRRHPQLDLRVCDADRDALPGGPFDAIILSDAIGLLEDIQVVLERLRPLAGDVVRVMFAKTMTNAVEREVEKILRGT